MNLPKRYPLVFFYSLAHLITWTFQRSGMVLAGRVGMTLSNETHLKQYRVAKLALAPLPQRL